MICEICEREFVLVKKHGGNNRKTCYDCIPENLTRQERNQLKNTLLIIKARTEKEKIGCSICGYNKFGGALEWHHDKDDKEKDPSDFLKCGWEAYKEETQKCILLCANCHREIHNK